MTSRREPSAELVAMRQAGEERAAAPDSEGVSLSVEQTDGVEVWRFSPEQAASDLALLYFHGGGFRLGSPKVFARYFARVAQALGATIFVPKYRLAPEAAFPGAIDDGLVVYRRLIADGMPAARMVLGGDSAGGTIAAALLLRISELGLESPAGAALFSPWLDLRLTAESFEANAATDAFFTRARASESAALYLQGHDPGDPLASPVLGDWDGQPPLLIQVSDIESLRDDALLLAERAAGVGVAVRLHRFPDTGHVWHNAFPDTPQSVAAIENVRVWLSERGLLA